MFLGILSVFPLHRVTERWPMAYIFNKHKLSHPYMVEANAIDYLIWVQSATESGGNAVMLKTPVLSSMCKMHKLWFSILRTSRPQENNQTLILQGFRPLWPNKILPHPILGRNRTNERKLPTWFLECELELHVFEVWLYILQYSAAYFWQMTYWVMTWVYKRNCWKLIGSRYLSFQTEVLSRNPYLLFEQKRLL